jgi:hypothetical protein
MIAKKNRVKIEQNKKAKEYIQVELKNGIKKAKRFLRPLTAAELNLLSLGPASIPEMKDN